MSAQTTTPDEIRRQLKLMSDQDAVHASGRWPFPTSELPDPMRSLVKEGAEALGCDPAMIALACIAIVGSAIGCARSILVKQGWIEHPVFWCVVVAPSGSGKSPAQRLACEPLTDMQRQAFERYELELAEHESEMKGYKARIQTWERSGGAGEPPVEPVRPTCERLEVKDTTIEALVPIMRENPRGTMLNRDELAG